MEISNVKFNENQSEESRVDAWGQTDMTEQIADPPYNLNALKRVLRLSEVLTTSITFTIRTPNVPITNWRRDI